ncbi:MAG: hypothetical protein AAGK47_07170, partial [Bacteroidota bacterium]
MNNKRFAITDFCSLFPATVTHSVYSLYLFIYFYISITAAIAQPPVQWDRTFGGNGYEELHAIASVNDGGFIFAGATESEPSGDIQEASKGGFDYWIVRTDSEGQMIWNKRFGGDGRDKVWSVIQTSDGGFLVGGESDSDIGGDRSVPNRGGLDYWIIKIDSAGNKQWDRAIGGNDEDILRTIVKTEDNGYLLGGYSLSNRSGEKSADSYGDRDFWVVKIDQIGNIQWDRTFGGADRDQLLSIKPTFDNEFILGGWSQSDISGVKTTPTYGGNDFWVVKMTENGDMVWDVTYGGDNEDVLQDIEPTSDGSFVLGGFSRSSISGNKISASLGEQDFYIIKINRNGNRIWERSLGGAKNDLAYEVRETRLGNYAIAGQTFSGINATKTENEENRVDYWLVTLDPNGTSVWSEVYGGSSNDALAELDIASDGGFVMAGQSGSDVSGDKTQNSTNLSDPFENDFWIIKTVCGQPEMLGTDTTLCQNEPLLLDATITDCGDCTYTWSDSTSTEARRTILPENGAVYKVTIDDPNGCLIEDSVRTRVLPIPSDIALDLSIPDCFGDTDGGIQIGRVMGGTSPFSYQLNDEPPTRNSYFPQLPTGTYTLSIVDVNNCQLDTTIELSKPDVDELLLDLGTYTPITLGDSVTITALSNQAIADIQWSDTSLV